MAQTQTQTASAMNGYSTRLRAYQHPQETTAELDWAELTVLDLSLLDQPGGKDILAERLRNAIQDIGFFYITNFGLDQQQIDRMFSIAQGVFDLPIDEKMKFKANIEAEGYAGYKPTGQRELAPGIFDNTELWSFAKFLPQYERRQPNILAEHRKETEFFSRHMHELGRKLMTLMAIILELPETYFSSRHRYDAPSGCNLRFMKYNHYPPDILQQLTSNPNNTNLLRGHTDFGSLTLLFRQPVAGLQVLTPADTWQWVRPHPGSITVNIADSLDFMTAGYLKSSVHRVALPPADQAAYDRLGIVYFMRPEDDVSLEVVDSPVIKAAGSRASLGPATKGMTAGEWCRERVKNNTRSTLEELDRPLVVNGVEIKKYH